MTQGAMRAIVILIAVGLLAGCASNKTSPTTTTPTTPTTGGAGTNATGTQLVTDTHDFTTDAAAGTPAGGAPSKAFTIPAGVTSLNLTVKWATTAPPGAITSGVTVKVGSLTCTIAAGPVQTPIPPCTKPGAGAPGPSKIEYSGAGPITATVTVMGS